MLYAVYGQPSATLCYLTEYASRHAVNTLRLLLLEELDDNEARGTDNDHTDHVREYALALTFYGLLDLCHRDFIREADGLGMISVWRINMLRFWSGNHYKYLNTGHRLLAGNSSVTVVINICKCLLLLFMNRV